MPVAALSFFGLRYLCATNLYPMTSQKAVSATDQPHTSTKNYWIYFLISMVIFFLMLIFLNQWFWVAMPFMLTFLVMALGYM